MEKSNCKRLVSYLNQEDTIHQQLDKNFKNYFNQYDKRRVKDFEKNFPSNRRMVPWHMSTGPKSPRN